MKHRRKATGGFTLLEVLIALIIMSIGLLGVFGLIVNALKANDSSNMRTQAAILANSIIDNIRANSKQTTSTAYSAAIGTAVSQPNPSTCTSSCTAAQLEAIDVYNWKQSLKTMLPSGDGSITETTANSVTTIRPSINRDSRVRNRSGNNRHNYHRSYTGSSGF